LHILFNIEVAEGKFNFTILWANKVYIHQVVT
jgi:hypothetical protein